uniref:Uncharacterized protein n=1 Tax=Tanacetum cinerariifolium TaxID=118510 RepID=A0A6L2KFX8_TANCI|nr:hypothetical protein [Tanacetum cinerariifolium]
MTSFSYRLNPRYAIKECLSCGALYTRDFCCSKGNVEDKILVPKLLKNYARCGHPVNGPYCQGCTLLREKLKEDLVTYFQDFQNTSESSDDSTNVVNAPREPFVFKQDYVVNPPHVDECCYECGDALDGIFCQQCTCKSCGKGAHIGYNCPPKVSIISNLELCNQTMNNELPQTLPSFDPTCYSDKENSLPCISKPNFVDESPNIFNPPPQPLIYSCEFCGSNAQYGHYCTPQVLFIYLEQGYSQDFNFPQDFHDFQQQYLCCDQCGGPHETIQSQQGIFYEPCCENCGGHTRIFSKKQEEKQIDEKQAANARYWKIPACCDDDDDYNSAFKPILSTEETVDSLSMGDKHLDTIPATESDEVISSSVEDLVLILNDNSSSDDDSLYNENIEYVEASPYNSEVVSLEVAEIVIPEEEEIEDDNLREKLLNVHLLIANIEALIPLHLPKISSGSTTTHSDISLPDYEAFYFYDDHIKEISSGSTTTHSDISLPDYEAFYFYDDHIKEISSGSTTTHYDVSLFEYDCYL